MDVDHEKSCWYLKLAPDKSIWCYHRESCSRESATVFTLCLSHPHLPWGWEFWTALLATRVPLLPWLWRFRLQAPATCLTEAEGFAPVALALTQISLPHPVPRKGAADTLWALLISAWQGETPRDLNSKFSKAQTLSPPHWVLRQKRVSELHCILIAPIQLNIKWTKQLYIANGKQAFSEAVRLKRLLWSSPVVYTWISHFSFWC